ncbi:MAG: CDP-glucose 4,6-dehydratase [Bacteroidales bacterium]|nr:CDP-glucose 4,6-dehydratase [Bacteroidales bacterium]
MELRQQKLFKDIYKGKKVLITGDTGFKGSWLTIWLLEMGAKVYGYALPPKTDQDNFVTTELSSKIIHKDGDVRDFSRLSSFFSEVKPDIAFHLAAQPLVLESYADPVNTFSSNLMGTVHFFEAVRMSDSVKAAINITSDKCYQNNEWVWGYRESDPMGGKDPYSASKGASELITSSYLSSFFSKEKTPNIASVRAGNVIGGGDWANDRIVPDFFRSVQRNEILKIRYPNATRPWQHVLEPLSGYLLLGAKLLTEGKIYSGGWNFGPLGDAHHSVETLIKKTIHILGKGEYKPIENLEKLHEAHLLKLDISKAIHYLKWNPTLNFDETVRFTVDGYKSEWEATDVYRSRVDQVQSFVELSLRRNNYL